MLLFKKKYLEDIRAGRKTQTIRVWKVRHMRPGQLSYIPGVGYIQIEAVDEVSLTQLTDEDARRNGCASADQLRAEVAGIYRADEANGKHVFRIRFHVLPPSEQARLRELRRQKKGGGTA